MAAFPYPALAFSQRSSAPTAFCLISAPVGEVLQWARVDRLEPDNLTGVQRRKNDSKTRSIKQFLTADHANTIPTALTVAIPFAAVNGVDTSLLGQTTVSARDVTINTQPGADLPGLIIDGQHRIFGMNEYDPNMLVSVVLVIGATDPEIAFQFLVINNKVSKVSPDHMKALRLAYQAEDLDARLTKSARMKSTGAPTYLETIDTEADSPFKGRLKWPRNPDSDTFRAIPPNAFEAALLYIQNQQITFSGEGDSKSNDFIVDFFLEIWRRIQKEWPQAWDEKNSRLLSKLGIVCFTQYIVDGVIARVEALEEVGSLENLDQLSGHVAKALERQEFEFWQWPWVASSLDTDAGRQLVLKDLKKIAANKRSNRPWHEGLGLVEKLDG
jgi:DGQHR domain-containing protein